MNNFKFIYSFFVIPGLPIDEAMALTLKHAGVSITITSLTDVFAFAVGSVTVWTKNLYTFFIV
jgi:Patched family